MEQRLELFFDKLARNPLPVPYAKRPGFLTSGAIRGQFSALTFLHDHLLTSCHRAPTPILNDS